ncbi:hypothetical protein M3O58_17565 [Xanthomonas nasturtii]|uniref:hypothetical protein n=1 Tax=Xanthomonas nasturtii TaxID=1843581 RepID=UPI0020122F71|nr:hypothetical protein [Xanthomonas nasturtii]MCL1570882.1 hypothetical protein [Xanthomonas nasturtii]MCL1574674.1 hypothetical protein [Xanthomonas nasturtii]MCL1586305.1 hypothetical protein [Xanthomonas nasturtii]MCL1662076.1 hypothetical protein [Xanthomonas nasturtii]
MKRLLQLCYVEGKVEGYLDWLYRVAFVIVNIDVRFQLQAVTYDLLSALAERPNEVAMRRVRIIQVSPKGHGLSSAFLCRGVLGTIAPPMYICTIFFTKNLSNISSDRINERFRVWLMKTIVQSPSRDLV